MAAPGWPREVGGLDLSLADQLDYYRMTTDAGAPPHPCPLSFILAPTLIAHGTQQQKDRFLRPLLRADEFWCQGFSEPGAGSDLSSLSTRAVRDGDVYRVTGQKVWTTMADRADWMFALVRTSSGAKPSDGITYLLIPMKTPGITVRPLAASDMLELLPRVAVVAGVSGRLERSDPHARQGVDEALALDAGCDVRIQDRSNHVRHLLR